MMKLKAAVALLLLFPVGAVVRGGQDYRFVRRLEDRRKSGMGRSGSSDGDDEDGGSTEPPVVRSRSRSGMRGSRSKMRRRRRRMRPTLPPATAPPTDPPQPTPRPTPSPTPDPTPAPTPPPTPAPTPSPTSPPTLSVVRQRLDRFLLQSGAEFNDPDSYQSCALARTEAHDGILDASEAKTVQYYVLYSIYCATYEQPNIITDNDPDIQAAGFLPIWADNTGWTDNSVDPCVCDELTESGYCLDVMYGIECDPGTDKVTGIFLEDNRLTGSWPPEVALLSSDGPLTSGAGSLEVLSIFFNDYLFNNLDSFWIPLLGSDMQYLWFGYTAFAGPLPVMPSGLLELDAQYTLIAGGLTDATFANTPNIEFILLDGNSFNTSIPLNVGQLSKLENFYAGNAFISGTLDFMEGLADSIIFEVWVDDNPGLGGTLATWLGDLDTLVTLSATDCALTGTLPTELGDMDEIQQMWFYGNMLTGTIPSEIGQLVFLDTFEVQDNDLTGEVATSICLAVPPFGDLEFLGVDCAEVSCSCCSCCSRADCGSE